MIVDCAVYDRGVRVSGGLAVDDALRTARSTPNGFVWIGLREPGQDELCDVGDVFNLHALAIEDAVHAHQRAKLEVYGDTVFVVVKAARYVDPEEIIDLSQIMIFLGEDFIITVRHGDTPVLGDVRKNLADLPDELSCGPVGVLHAILDRVVDNYGLVIRDLDGDIDQVEQEVFSTARVSVAERIYRLKREVLEFRQAVHPLADPLEQLSKGTVPHSKDAPAEYFRDVHDHVMRIADRLDSLDALLTSALSANLAQVGVRQNEDMRKISAWVAILAVPTMIAGIYGMNFDHMPELGWVLGYPAALAVMVAVCSGLFVLFRRRGWL